MVKDFNLFEALSDLIDTALAHKYLTIIQTALKCIYLVLYMAQSVQVEEEFHTWKGKESMEAIVDQLDKVDRKSCKMAQLILEIFDEADDEEFCE